MRTITKLSILASLFICLNIQAQHKAGPLGEDNIINTKRELKREKKVKESSTAVAKNNEHKARKKHKLGTKLFHKPNKVKRKKSKTAPQEEKIAVNSKKS